MQPFAKIVALACLAGISAMPGVSRGTDAVPDAAGVRDAENRWSEAFITGNTATLDALLDADYVSVNSSGKPRGKVEILGLAREYAGKHPGQHAKPLPPTSTIRVIGNAAIVRHQGGNDTSVDVFYFRDGRWHAWYSQHSGPKR